MPFLDQCDLRPRDCLCLAANGTRTVEGVDAEEPKIVGLLGLEIELVTSMRGPITSLDMSAKHSPHRAQRSRLAQPEAGAQERIEGEVEPLGLAEGCTHRNQ